METTKIEKDELFTRWMNDAYRMEMAMMPVLEHHIDDAEGHPIIQAKLHEHLDATHHHADLVRSCLDRLGKAGPADGEPADGEAERLHSNADDEAASSPSHPHTVAASPLSGAHAVADGSYSDLLIKDGFNDFSTEQYEIATYKALITAARDLGQMECERAFEEILSDEQEMANWLDINLPLLVEQTIRHAA